MDNNPFEQAANCVTKAERVTSESDCSVNYMLIRTLSMGASTFFAAATANEASNRAPAWAVRMYAHVLCPKGRAARSVFVKKEKATFTDKEKVIIKEVAKVLHVSPRHAEESYGLMKDQGVDFNKIFGQRALVGKTK